MDLTSFFAALYPSLWVDDIDRSEKGLVLNLFMIQTVSSNVNTNIQVVSSKVVLEYCHNPKLEGKCIENTSHTYKPNKFSK